MSGRIVATPPQGHACAPGWTTRYCEASSLFGAGTYAFPPDASKYPKGTVWECGCGQTWVSTGPVAWNSPGFTGFRRERRGERRRRERRAADGA